VLLASGLIGGCSLLTIKSPEVPLTPEQQDARLLTRDYASHFATTMTHLIDEVAAKENDPAVKSHALRLKLGVVSESTRAATGLSPVGSLLDTWAFADQLRDFLSSDSDAKLLGGSQADVTNGAQLLADEMDEIAKKVTAGDYARYKAFVDHYAFRYPLEGADCQRPSLLSIWVAEGNDPKPLRAFGTVSQALGDVSDRLRIYGEVIPQVSLWQAESALDRSGIDASSYKSAFHSIDAQLAKISTLAETSPALAHEAIGELRAGLADSADRLDNAWQQTLETLRVERAATAQDVAVERVALTAAVDMERARITADAAQIAARAVDTSWNQLRKLVREALLLLILLAVVMLGLPFSAGYLVGRWRGASARARSSQ
jgi:hypothetical protein